MTTVRHLSNKGVRPEWPSSRGDAVTAATPRPACLTRVVATWHAVINFLVPIGYEDEWGFHYGEPPARKNLGRATAS